MAFFSPKSQAAIARLRSYLPPPSSWHQLPLSRRSSVLILLFPDKKGDLRVVLTMRASTLSSYAGQAALPGGKADNLQETPLHIARREAFEEIGLPEPAYNTTISTLREDEGPMTPTPAQPPTAPSPEDTKYSPHTPGLPYPFRLEHLCQLPAHLAKTELGVRPCVAVLYPTAPVDRNNQPVDAEATLIPTLDAKEVAAVFSGPLHNFLKSHDELPIGTNVLDSDPARAKEQMTKPPGQWYKGSWVDWYDAYFRMHNFYVPVKGQTVTRPKTSRTRLPYRDLSVMSAEDAKKDPLDRMARYRVFGMTARILVDCARVAYGEEPEFEHNIHFGDEDLIDRLIKIGKLDMERQKGEEFNGDEIRKALAEAVKKGLISPGDHDRGRL